MVLFIFTLVNINAVENAKKHLIQYLDYSLPNLTLTNLVFNIILEECT